MFMHDNMASQDYQKLLVTSFNTNHDFMGFKENLCRFFFTVTRFEKDLTTFYCVVWQYVNHAKSGVKVLLS